MTGTWRDQHVRVRRLPSGVIRVGPYSTGPAGVARVNLPGSTLIVDPALPNCMPTLEISDVAEAQELTRKVCGAPLAEAILTLERETLVGPAVDPIAILSPRLLDLRLLGQLIWLVHAAPWPLPSAVLVAELVTATEDCLNLLEEPALVRQALEEQAEPLGLALAAAVEAVLPSTVIARLRAACGAVARVLPMSDPRSEWLWEAFTASTGPATSEPLAGPAEALLEACRPVSATHAGVADGTLYTGSATAEWSRNRSGLVSRNEDNVSWTVEARGSSQAEVTLVANKSLPEPRVGGIELPTASVESLLRVLSGDISGRERAVSCSIHSPAWPLPLTEFLLDPHPVTGDLVGHASLHGPAGQALHAAMGDGSLIVDVHDAGYRYAHLGPVSSTVEAARRWSARAVCASRLAMSSPGQPETAAAADGAWHRALALWRHSEVTENPDLARERIRQCNAWLQILRGAAQTPEPAPPDLPDAVGPEDLPCDGMAATLTEVLAGAGASDR